MCLNPLGISVTGHVKRLNLILFKMCVVEIKKWQEETPDGNYAFWNVGAVLFIYLIGDRAWKLRVYWYW
jgi:hypothetical protein